MPVVKVDVTVEGDEPLEVEYEYADETEDQVIERVTGAVLDAARAEAERASVPFDPTTPLVKARIEMAISESLDELGFCHPPE